jgi:hypothetical protein
MELQRDYLLGAFWSNFDDKMGITKGYGRIGFAVAHFVARILEGISSIRRIIVDQDPCFVRFMLSGHARVAS